MSGFQKTPASHWRVNTYSAPSFDRINFKIRLFFSRKKFVLRDWSVSRKIVNIWSSRGLSIYGKVTIKHAKICLHFLAYAGPQGNR